MHKAASFAGGTARGQVSSISVLIVSESMGFRHSIVMQKHNTHTHTHVHAHAHKQSRSEELNKYISSLCFQYDTDAKDRNCLPRDHHRTEESQQRQLPKHLDPKRLKTCRSQDRTMT